MQYLGIVIIILVFVLLMMLVVGKIRKRRLLKRTIVEEFSPPTMGNFHDYDDGVIAVRKKIPDISTQETVVKKEDNPHPKTSGTKQIIVLHVMSREKTVFAGYELLQALLSSGLRFGDMNIFHYYRDAETSESFELKQDILFSLASATEPGIFDMVNMGAFSCKGLTLFMRKSEDANDNEKRYDLMLKTAEHLSEDLDGVLLDEQRRPLSVSRQAVNE